MSRLNASDRVRDQSDRYARSIPVTTYDRPSRRPSPCIFPLGRSDSLAAVFPESSGCHRGFTSLLATVSVKIGMSPFGEKGIRGMPERHPQLPVKEAIRDAYGNGVFN